MAKMNVRQVEAFNAVMRAGSVTQAAKALFVTQPAATKLLQAFRDGCGFDLFTRRGGRLVPTPEARQLFVETEKLGVQVARVQEAARAMRDLERGEIAIVTFPGIGMRLVPRAISNDLIGRDDVRVSLLTRTSRGVADAMLQNAADLGISLVPTNLPALECERFLTTSMVCALPEGHCLAAERGAGQSITLAEIAGDRKIALGRDDLSHPVIERAFSRAGYSFDPVAQVTMADAVCALVAEGFGIGVVPSFIADPRDHPGVAFRPLAERIEVDLWLLKPAFATHSNIAQSLMAGIRSAILKMERGGMGGVPRGLV